MALSTQISICLDFVEAGKQNRQFKWLRAIVGFHEHICHEAGDRVERASWAAATAAPAKINSFIPGLCPWYIGQ
jgi:hypothetical protein